ncbi:DUF2533 family protein [Bacillus sp. 2205SS5-2]|uniref:DUF2533 family protein n=1 Tax=Bacillus sp. 2205SS5-2 TaxID=3109031 RepID=UPI0030078223
MSVHKAITKLTTEHNKIATKFADLEKRREQYIEESVALCQQNIPFTTEKINAVTNEMNDLARSGVVPTRELVSVEMVKEYVNKLN